MHGLDRRRVRLTAPSTNWVHLYIIQIYVFWCSKPHPTYCLNWREVDFTERETLDDPVLHLDSCMRRNDGICEALVTGGKGPIQLPRNQHGYLALIVEIGLAKLGNQIALFQIGSKRYPTCE